MSDKVTISFKSKWVWLIFGIIFILIATSPVVSSYLPTTTSSAPSTPSTPSPSSSSSSPSGPAVNCPNPCTIVIQNSQFGSNPNGIVVKAGTTVTWVNKDDTVHTSTSNTGLWNSNIIDIGSSYSHTFNTPGTFPYHCEVHPMTGIITVVS
jgi:plastocyanin